MHTCRSKLYTCSHVSSDMTHIIGCSPAAKHKCWSNYVGQTVSSLLSSSIFLYLWCITRCLQCCSHGPFNHHWHGTSYYFLFCRIDTAATTSKSHGEETSSSLSSTLGVAIILAMRSYPLLRLFRCKSLNLNGVAALAGLHVPQAHNPKKRNKTPRHKPYESLTRVATSDSELLRSALRI